jgi:hypothetical protein
MKVLFFIHSNDPSTGGHYHSLNSISRQLSAFVEVGIVSTGVKPSPVFEDNPLFKEHVVYAGPRNYLSFLLNVKKVIERMSPDVIHCFDTKVLSLITPVIAFKKIKLVLNKCGGRNPLGKRYVYCDNIIFFSLENYEWFDNSPFYKRLICI